MYGKRNFDYVRGGIEALKCQLDTAMPELRICWPYDDAVGVYPCHSFNLGTQTTTYPHTDLGNLANSWCSITAFGQFDPTEGGHFVLWDYGLFVDFPPGLTILMPSALLLHSTTSISNREKRFSMIQYISGHLLRWVENGFWSDKEWGATATAEDEMLRERENEAWWSKAVNMYAVLEEFCSV
ncbi:hypothetical protein APHAL10511_000882 [Amanita phalloides]|nr:hypothetical protein APHAL10511_000882 [Amanita phalloides]